MVVAADRLGARHVGQRLGQHPGDVRRDRWRRVVHPVGDDADLRVGEIGDHVARQPAPRQIARRRQQQQRGDHDAVVAGGPVDQARDHGVMPPVARPLSSRRSASRKKVARDTTRSLGRSPDSTTANPWREKVSPISIGRFSNV